MLLILVIELFHKADVPVTHRAASIAPIFEYVIFQSLGSGWVANTPDSVRKTDIKGITPKRRVVGPRGLEPRTSGLRVRCSTN